MSKPKYINIKIPVIEVSDNKLILSPLAIETLQMTPGDRVSVNYVQVDNEVTYPIISKSIVFGDPENGNKCSKSNTVSFKGTQRTILMKYGNLFTLKPDNRYKEAFKLISINEVDLNVPELIDEVNNLNNI